MTELLNFMGEHWLLTWFLSWGVLVLAIVVIGTAFRIVNRVLRTIKVLFRGWPPSHLDADGDFRKASEDAA